MSMLPESDGVRPRSASDGRVPVRRLVAVVVSVEEVLDAGSDLHRVAAGAGEVDVLVVRRDVSDAARGRSPFDAPDYGPDHGPDHGHDGPAGYDGSAGDVDEILAGFTVPVPVVTPGRVAAPGESPVRRPDPGIPAGMHLHHLDLRWRVQDDDEPDLVAALSELVGFDPDEHVFCVAPVGGPAGAVDPESVVLARAVGRVARVYGLPVLRYHVPGDPGRIVAPPVRAHAVRA